MDRSRLRQGFSAPAESGEAVTIDHENSCYAFFRE